MSHLPAFDAMDAARRAALPEHRFTAENKDFDAKSNAVVLINGFNQRRDDSTQHPPSGSKWCCACYTGPFKQSMLGGHTELLSCQWHRCATCRCNIHTAVMCNDVTPGDEDGTYFCGHCFYLKGLDDGYGPGHDGHDGNYDDEAPEEEHVWARPMQEEQQEEAGPQAKKPRVMNCNYCKDNNLDGKRPQLSRLPSAQDGGHGEGEEGEGGKGRQEE